MPLYATKKYDSLEELRGILNGPLIARGSLGTNLINSPDLGVPVAAGEGDDFTDVVVGDRILIEGESLATTFLVQTKTDDQNIVLDNNIVAAHVGNAKWRALRAADAISVAKIQFGGPLQSHMQVGAGVVVYDQS
jgi:hypothetical protein